MSTIFNCDVTIVGSGPAGTSAAISCAKRGLSVVLIEEKQFPRYRPGETLHPGIEPLLKELGVAKQVLKAGFLRHKGNVVKWEDDFRFIPFGSDENGPWFGFQAWRAKFDAILLDRAISLGVKVLQPCRALQPIFTNKRVEGVVTSFGEVRSPYVIDATGRRQWLARKLSLNIKKYSPLLIVRFGYAEGICRIRNSSPAIVADEKGWTWTAKVRPNVYQWTRLSLEDETLEKGWLPKEYRGLKALGKMSGENMTWRMAIQPSGPGYYIVGDAATVLDPASSHGVLKAIMSGMMVGHLIDQVIRKNQSEESASSHYCRWVCNWFENDVEELKKLYALLPNFNDSKWKKSLFK